MRAVTPCDQIPLGGVVSFMECRLRPSSVHFYSLRLFHIYKSPVSPLRAVLSGALREKPRRGHPRRGFFAVLQTRRILIR
jgi:hypothetical protein